MTDSRPHLAACVCPHVFRGERPVRYAAFDELGWQFLCGEDYEGEGGPHVVGAEHIFERDPSLAAIRDLKSGWQAERDGPGAPWTRSPMPPEDEC